MKVLLSLVLSNNKTHLAPLHKHQVRINIKQGMTRNNLMSNHHLHLLVTRWPCIACNRIYKCLHNSLNPCLTPSKRVISKLPKMNKQNLASVYNTYQMKAINKMQCFTLCKSKMKTLLYAWFNGCSLKEFKVTIKTHSARHPCFMLQEMVKLH